MYVASNHFGTLIPIINNFKINRGELCDNLQMLKIFK